MRILFLGNNRVAWQILSWLKGQGAEIVALVIHSPEKRKYGDEIIKSAQIDQECIFDASQLHQPAVLKAIEALHPHIGVSAFFGYILRRDFLSLLPAGCVNIHPALLPYNRGAFPNVWSIIDGTPAGTTLHYMDTSVDTGDIITQRAVCVEAVDTGETLYHKLERACVDLFKETWPLICRGEAPRTPQQQLVGSYHSIRDVEKVDEIDLNKVYRASELIDAIRARTFPPYPGTYFWHEGRKVYLRLQLLHEDQLGR